MSDDLIARLAPCPFCGAHLKHKTSWAKSFQPNRLYHEYHHPDVADCPMNRGPWCFADDEHNDGAREVFIARWNRRPATALEAPADMRERAELADALDEWGEQEGVTSGGVNILQSAAKLLRTIPAAPAPTSPEIPEWWKAERDAALAEVGRLSEVLRQIAKKDTKPYIQIGDDPNFPGETLYVPGEIAKIAYIALEWMRDRDNRNGSLPAAYREKIDEALRESAFPASPPLPEGE